MDEAVRDFTLDQLRWAPYLTPVSPAAATPAQRAALQQTPSGTRVSDYVLVLAHDPQSLGERTPLFNEIMYAPGGLSRAARELGALAASVVNRCVYCAQVHASRFIGLHGDPDTVARVFADGAAAEIDAREQALLEFSVKLTRTPEAMGPDDLARLRDAGLSDLDVADLIHSVAIFGWANRLMHTLGEPVRRPG